MTISIVYIQCYQLTLSGCREVIEDRGKFAQELQICPRHRAFKMLKKPNPGGNILIQYIVFDNGDKSNIDSILMKLLSFTTIADNDAESIIQTEIKEAFKAATKRWGLPRLSVEHVLGADLLNSLRAWPEPRFV